MEESEDKRGFKVQDRRRFSAEGEAKAGDEAPSERVEALEIKSKPDAPGPESISKPQAAASQTAPNRHSNQAPPELTFAAFLWSLSEQALAALGEIPDPASGQVMHDLIMAQQMIDIIIMLRDKTRGNLDPHEQALLKEILSSLQMKYVELARPPSR
ncbi:MAG: DUF1844 domain-containing protein [Candidatus Binatus sp.]